MKLATIKNRIYADYFLPNRLTEYKHILQIALEKGYTITSVIDYYDRKIKGEINIDSKIIINRHDIDSDIKKAREIFLLEKELGVRSSFYFRLSTLSPRLMQDIEEYGSEASYHYEEIASYCKRHHIRSRQDAFKVMPEIQNEFESNFFKIRKQFSLPMRSVASHGDFVNRHLNIINYELLTPIIRSDCAIEVEAYDSIIKEDSISVSDTGSPQFWLPEPIINLINAGVSQIYCLTHPRHWGAAPLANTKENLLRIWEGINYKF